MTRRFLLGSFFATLTQWRWWPPQKTPDWGNVRGATKGEIFVGWLRQADRLDVHLPNGDVFFYSKGEIVLLEKELSAALSPVTKRKPQVSGEKNCSLEVLASIEVG